MSKSKWSFLQDEDLMQHFCNGKNAAFDELYIRYYSKLYNYILHSTSFTSAQTKDILHDVFVKIIENKRQFDQSKKLSVWIYTLINNECRNIYKHHIIKDKSQNEISKTTKTEEARVKDISQAKQIRTSIKKLKPIYKQVFLLRFNFGFSIKETAQILDITEGTVKSRLFNCIQILNKQEEILEIKQNR
jgi:RNA polymerase sigma-70 factor (ECF subfamily)